MNFKRIHSFNNELKNLGVSASTVSIAEPKLSVGTSHDAHTRSEVVVFETHITEPEIRSVCLDLFTSGHYNLAVAEAFKALDIYVAEKIGQPKSSGTAMMEAAFSPTKPKLFWSERKTKSEEDEQKGYQRMFAGAMLGIRNPVTHSFDWVTSADEAVDLIVVAQHLLRKAKAATKI